MTSKTGWTRIDQGVWRRESPQTTYELMLLVQPHPNQSEEILAALKIYPHTSWPVQMMHREIVLGTEVSTTTFGTLIRKYVRRAQKWANEEIQSPMERLASILARLVEVELSTCQ